MPSAEPLPAQPVPQPVRRRRRQSTRKPKPKTEANELKYLSDNFVYADVAYTVEYSHWPTPSGHGAVFVSGFEFTESRGVFTNFMLAGLAGSATHQQCVQADSSGCRVVRETGATEHEKAMARGIAANRPFALTLRGYHEAFGSEVDGFEAQIAYVTGKAGVASMAGVTYGTSSSNRLSAPLAMPDPNVPTPPPDTRFSRDWVGAIIETRVGTNASRGARLTTVIGYWDSWIVRVEFEVYKRLGPFHVGGGVVTDSYKPSRAGARASLGVSF